MQTWNDVSGDRVDIETMKEFLLLLLSLQFYLNPSPVSMITEVPAYVGNAHM